MATKLCECGCGEPAPIATQNKPALGIVKGQPLRFRAHHYKRTRTTKKYPRVFAPTHPRASSGCIGEHVAIAERALGHYLPDGAVVHHVDENPRNNEPRNLVICQDTGYHMLLHRRLRAYRASGHADYRLCSFCGRYDDPATMVASSHGASFRHSVCLREYTQAQRAAAS